MALKKKHAAMLKPKGKAVSKDKPVGAALKAGASSKLKGLKKPA